MRVLSTEEFIKKIDRAAKSDSNHTPMMEICPNWQLRLELQENDGELGRWLGPNPSEMSKDSYTEFLSEIDELAGSTLARSFVMDGWTGRQ